MPEPRAVLWDLDGTIVDSQEFHWLAWQRTLGPSRITHQQFLKTFGQTNATFLPDWLDTNDEAEISTVSIAKEACFREMVLAAGLAPLPGAKEWIERLHAAGWRQAIASSAPRANIEAMLAGVGLRNFFTAIVAAEDVTRGKPDPQVFLEAAKKLQVPPENCVVVEDAPAGIEAARRAGMRSVGVSGSARLEATMFAPCLAALPWDAFDRLLKAEMTNPRTDSRPDGG